MFSSAGSILNMKVDSIEVGTGSCEFCNILVKAISLSDFSNSHKGLMKADERNNTEIPRDVQLDAQ